MSIVTEAYEEQNHLNPDFPVRCSYSHKNFTFPAHYHKGIEVICVTSGEMMVHVNNHPYSLHAGDLLFIGSYHIHSYGTDSKRDKASFYMLILDWHYLNESYIHHRDDTFFAPLLLQTHCLKGKSDFPKAAENILQEITAELKDDLPGMAWMVTGDVCRLLTLATRQVDPDTGTSLDVEKLEKNHATMGKINRLIYNSYRSEITLERAAQTAGYSVYHFTRLFKSLTGTTFKAYLTAFRISQIKEALKATDIPITDLALKHGFNNLKTFNRNFLKNTGMTPTEYRKSNI